MKTQTRIPDSRRGQTMIEAIVAISVLLAGFLGIFNLLSSSLHSNRIVSENASATYLAAEGIEIVKNILDHDVITRSPWGTGVAQGDFEADYSSAGLSSYAGAGRNLFFNTTNNFYDYSGTGVSTNFKRRIRITIPAPEEIVVNSIVSWTTGSAKSSVNLEDHFLNWRP